MRSCLLKFLFPTLITFSSLSAYLNLKHLSCLSVLLSVFLSIYCFFSVYLPDSSSISSFPVRKFHFHALIGALLLFVPLCWIVNGIKSENCCLLSFFLTCLSNNLSERGVHMLIDKCLSDSVCQNKLLI